MMNFVIRKWTGPISIGSKQFIINLVVQRFETRHDREWEETFCLQACDYCKWLTLELQVISVQSLVQHVEESARKSSFPALKDFFLDNVWMSGRRRYVLALTDGQDSMLIMPPKERLSGFRNRCLLSASIPMVDKTHITLSLSSCLPLSLHLSLQEFPPPPPFFSLSE